MQTPLMKDLELVQEEEQKEVFEDKRANTDIIKEKVEKSLN